MAATPRRPPRPGRSPLPWTTTDGARFLTCSCPCCVTMCWQGRRGARTRRYPGTSRRFGRGQIVPDPVLRSAPALYRRALCADRRRGGPLTQPRRKSGSTTGRCPYGIGDGAEGLSACAPLWGERRCSICRLRRTSRPWRRRVFGCGRAARLCNATAGGHPGSVVIDAEGAEVSGRHGSTGAGATMPCRAAPIGYDRLIVHLSVMAATCRSCRPAGSGGRRGPHPRLRFLTIPERRRDLSRGCGPRPEIAARRRETPPRALAPLPVGGGRYLLVRRIGRWTVAKCPRPVIGLGPADV